MEINLNVLCSSVKNWIGRKISRTNVVTIEKKNTFQTDNQNKEGSLRGLDSLPQESPSGGQTTTERKRETETSETAERRKAREPATKAEKEKKTRASEK